MKRTFPGSTTSTPEGAQRGNDRSEWPLDPDDFAAYYRFAPAALAVRECLRLRAVRHFELAEPILDIGCGDGVFARLAYPGRQIWGIDINPAEIRRAQATAAYSTLVCGSITNVDLPAGFFNGAIANCSLEHVPGLGEALISIRTSLSPAAQFLVIVPTPTWTELLAIPALLSTLGLPSLAAAYGRGLDETFRHLHLYDADEWRHRLDRAGFVVREVQTLASRRSSWVFDALLYPSLFGYLTRKVTGKWVLSPMLRSLSADLTRKVVDLLAERVSDSEDGSEYLLVCDVKSE